VTGPARDRGSLSDMRGADDRVWRRRVCGSRAVSLDVRGVGGGGEADVRPWRHNGWQEQTTESDKRVLPGPCIR